MYWHYEIEQFSVTMRYNYSKSTVQTTTATIEQLGLVWLNGEVPCLGPI